MNLFKRSPVQQEPSQQETSFAQAIEELMELVRQDKFPQGLELEEVCQDPAFAALLTELPAYAALRVYQAEQAAQNARADVMEELTLAAQTRQELPRPTRANRALAPQEDYMSMSPEAFRAWEAMMKRRSPSTRK